MAIIMNNNTKVIDFFKYLNQVTNINITSVELKPSKIKKDMYITGFRRIGISMVEAHIKRMESYTEKINANNMETKLKNVSNEEIWMDTELLTTETVHNALNDIKNYFFKLNSFIIAQIQYKLKTDVNNLCTQEENIIYDDKRIACKELITKRKLCSIFKSHFVYHDTTNGNNNSNCNNHQYHYTDEEIAEMA